MDSDELVASCGLETITIDDQAMKTRWMYLWVTETTLQTMNMIRSWWTG
jgi:hypothetical protein